MLAWKASKMNVCDLIWLPRKEARAGDRPQMAGDVLINTTRQVLSPKQTSSPATQLSALHPGHDQQWLIPHFVAPSLSSQHSTACAHMWLQKSEAADLPMGRKPDVLSWPSGSQCRLGGRGMGTGM